MQNPTEPGGPLLAHLAAGSRSVAEAIAVAGLVRSAKGVVRRTRRANPRDDGSDSVR